MFKFRFFFKKFSILLKDFFIPKRIVLHDFMFLKEVGFLKSKILVRDPVTNVIVGEFHNIYYVPQYIVDDKTGKIVYVTQSNTEVNYHLDWNYDIKKYL